MIAPPLRGHYAPLCVLAETLIGRGHSVTFVHQEEARQLVDAPGAAFAAIGNSEPPLEQWTGPMARIRHLLDLRGTMNRMRGLTTMICNEAPATLQRIGADAVIADQLEPAGGMIADFLGLPFVTVATALPINREPGVPPPFVSWRYDPSPKGVRRNKGGWIVTDGLMRAIDTNVAANAVRLRIGRRSRIEDCFSPLLQLTQLSSAFDFPRTELPPSFHYVGPFRRAASDEFLLPPTDGRPTAYATLGSIQGSRSGLFARIADACDRTGVRLVIAHGGKGGKELRSLPGNPLVFDWVPQDAVLRQVDLVIGHAGMNTSLDALLHGIPMIVAPLTFEQPGIAARIVRSGAGLMIRPTAPARSFQSAIRHVLDDPSFKANAMKQAGGLRTAGGVSRAAELIEQAFSPGVSREAATMGPPGTGDAHGDIRSGSR